MLLKEDEEEEKEERKEEEKDIMQHYLNPTFAARWFRGGVEEFLEKAFYYKLIPALIMTPYVLFPKCAFCMYL